MQSFFSLKSAGGKISASMALLIICIVLYLCGKWGPCTDDVQPLLTRLVSVYRQFVYVYDRHEFFSLHLIPCLIACVLSFLSNDDQL